MSLTNMKMSKKDAKEEFAIGTEDDSPRFPHGLTLHLNDDSLKKLGITKLPAIGEKLIIGAVGEVTSASEHKQRSGASRDVSIQLQDVDIGPADDGKPKSAEDAVSQAVEEA